MAEIGEKRIPPPPAEKNPIKVRSDPFRSVGAMLRHMVAIFVIGLLVLYLVSWLFAPVNAPITVAFVAIFVSAAVAVLGGLWLAGE